MTHDYKIQVQVKVSPRGYWYKPLGFAGQLPVAALDEPHGEPGVDAHPAAARVRAGSTEESGAAEAQLI